MFNSNKDTIFGKRDDIAQKDSKLQGLSQRTSVTSGTSVTNGRTDTAMPAAQTTTAPPVTPAVLPASPGSKLIVGPDIKLKGVEITDCDTLVVEGRVEASMDSRVMQIAEHGVYSGTVGIDVAEIHGRFEGELTARKQLVIHATGRVSGTIRYGKLTIEEGGELSGDISTLSGTAPLHTGNGAHAEIMTSHDPFTNRIKPTIKNAGASH